MDVLTLRIISPEGDNVNLTCDSVTLFARDGANGEGGGSVGVRRGHIPALIALENESAINVFLKGTIIASFKVSGAFAGIKQNVITVIAEKIIK